MNVPNILTLSRFVLIPLFLLLYLYDHNIAAIVVFLIAGLTDLLDGYIARRSGQVTVAGSLLDPLADKLMMLAVVVGLLLKDMLPWSAVAVMAFRELSMIVITTYYHFTGLKTIPANTIGKATTVVYYLAIVLLFLELLPAGVALFWIAIVLSYIASFVYLAKFRRINRI